MRARQDHSVASGRSMEQIAAGKGRRPKPFMLRQGEERQGRRDLALEPDKDARKTNGATACAKAANLARARAQSSGHAMPRFHPPQLCKTRRPAAAGRRLGA